MMNNPVNRGDLFGRLRKDYLEHSLDKTENESIIFRYKKEENDEKAERICRVIMNMPKSEEALKGATTLKELILACPGNEFRQSDFNPYVMLSVLERLYDAGAADPEDVVRFLDGILTEKNEKEFKKIGRLCLVLGISKRKDAKISGEGSKDDEGFVNGGERQKALHDFLTDKAGITGLFKESLLKDIVNNFWPKEIRSKTGKVSAAGNASGFLETDEEDTVIDVSAAASLKWNYRDDIRLLNFYLSETEEEVINATAGDVLADPSFVRDWEDFYATVNRPSRGPFAETFLIYVRPDSLVSLWIMGSDLLNRNGILDEAKGIAAGKNYYYVLKAECSVDMDDVYEDAGCFVGASSQYMEIFSDLPSALNRMNSADFAEKSTENLTNLEGSLSVNMAAVMEYEKIRNRQLGRIKPSEEDRRIAEEYAEKERGEKISRKRKN